MTVSRAETLQRDDIQGIILSGYKHLPVALYLFLKFTDASQARSWLGTIAPQITTAELWDTLPNGEKAKPASALHIGLTIDALKILGLSDETLATFPAEFTAGIMSRSNILGDVGESAPENWELGGTNGEPIHAILLMFTDTETTMDKIAAQQRAQITATNGGVVEFAAQGGTRPDSLKEPFGFRDGIGQPLILGNQLPGRTERGIEPINPGEFILGYPDEHDQIKPMPTIQENGQEIFNIGLNGTFVVYRKLEQDVAGFWQYNASQSIGMDGKPDPHLTALSAAKMVGRWTSGAPLVLSPEHDDPSLADSDGFLFMDKDPHGFRCPVGAHIRRNNPRDSLLPVNTEASLDTSDSHRIIRRAIPYGKPLFPPEAVDGGNAPLDYPDDGEKRGIHFFAINASIHNQFEFVMQVWTNNPSFNGIYNSKDAVIGDNDGTGILEYARDPIRKRMMNLPRFVTVRGGAYLFMPGIKGLEYLAGM